MKKNIMLLSALLFLAAASLYAACAADAAKILTNQDLKKYDTPGNVSPNDASVKQEPAPQKTEPSQEPPKEQEKQSWCTKASHFKNRVEAANKKVDEAQRQRNAATMPGDANSYASAPVASAEDKLAQAKQELDAAEKELSDFEQLAYSQGIPPGWLRCQFD
jgi:hypothetical protein